MISHDSIPVKEQTFFVQFLADESDIDTIPNYQVPDSQRESVFEGHALQVSDTGISPELKATGFHVPSWFFLVFIIQLLFIAIVVTVFRHSFFLQLNSIFSGKNLEQFAREGNPLFKTPSLLLLFVYILSMSLFGFISIRLKVTDIAIPDASLFGYLVLILLSFPLFKLLFFGFIGQVSGDHKINGFYITNIYVYDVLIGIIILPLVFLFAYRPIPEIFYLIILLIVLLFTMRAFRSIYIIIQHAKFTSLYIILYLCTLEIVPVLLVTIWILRMTGYPV